MMNINIAKVLSDKNLIKTIDTGKNNIVTEKMSGYYVFCNEDNGKRIAYFSKNNKTKMKNLLFKEKLNSFYIDNGSYKKNLAFL